MSTLRVAPAAPPLSLLDSKKEAEIVEVLLDRGADVNAQSGDFGDVLGDNYAKGHNEVAQGALHRGLKKSTAHMMLDQGASQCQHTR